MEGKMQGLLTLIGGAEDKRDEMVVLRKMLEKTQAQSIVIIPTASYYSREVHESYTDAFRRTGVNKVETFDIRYADEADRAEYHQQLNEADLVYFSGGDQTKLIRTLQNSSLLQKIRHRFLNSGLHVAGTSAGAAAAGNMTIFDGDYQGFNKNSVNAAEGFGFVDDLIVDTHFLSRERIPRLLQFLLTGQYSKGIGIDEDTAITIFPDQRFEVFGSGMVTIINTEKITGSNYQQIGEKDIYTVNNVRLGFLAPGSIFSLKRWAILRTGNEKSAKELSINNIFLNY